MLVLKFWKLRGEIFQTNSKIKTFEGFSFYKGSFTCYVIKEGGFQMITFDYEGGGGFGQ